MSLAYDCLTAMLFHLLPLEFCPPHASSEENISMETTTMAAHRGEGGVWVSGFYFVGQEHQGALEVCHNKKHQGGTLRFKQQTFT